MTLAQQRLDVVRTEATDLSAKISDAQTQQAKLEAEIADAEARIPQLRARAAELRTQVKERAAQLYMRHGNAATFESAMDAENAEDERSCAAHLTDTIGTHDLDLAGELRDTAAKLAEREAQLKVQREDLQKTIASLAPLNDLLQKKLAVASDAYDKVHAVMVDGVTKKGLDVTTGATECPVKGLVVFTDDFGELRSGGVHPGIDMGAAHRHSGGRGRRRSREARRRRRRRERRLARRPRQGLLLLRALLEVRGKRRAGEGR